MAYDPELDTLYVGTGNGSPWNRDIRSPGGGDNLYLSSILAMNPDTGRLKWHYQVTPADDWDYTATQHIILADLTIGGKPRKVLMQAPKNGFFYVLDRVTGELLSADKYIPATWATHVDLKTGRPVETPEASYSKETRLIVPAAVGGHNWQPMAYNPTTGLVYIPAMQPMGIYPPSQEFIKSGKYTRRDMFWNPGIDWNTYIDTVNGLVQKLGSLPVDRGSLKAWDPVQKKTVWEIEHPAFWNGGLLTTAGNLLFQGTGDGKLVAYAADTGKIAWAVPTMIGIVAPPITYEVDGEQYVAVMAGYGGAGGVSLGDPRTMASAKYMNDGYVMAFKLGGKAAMPRVAEKNASIPEPPAIDATAAQIENGKYKYMSHLHGVPRRARRVGRRAARPADAACREARDLQGDRPRRRHPQRRHAADGRPRHRAGRARHPRVHHPARERRSRRRPHPAVTGRPLPHAGEVRTPLSRVRERARASTRQCRRKG